MFIGGSTMQRRFDVSLLSESKTGLPHNHLGGVSVKLYHNNIGEESESVAETSMIPIPGDLIRPYEPEQVEAVVVLGDAMIETGLYPGDIVLFVQERLKGNGIYVVRLFGELTVKRLEFRLAGSIRILSDNPSYGVEEIASENLGENPAGFVIEGRVIGWFHRYSG